MVVCYCAQRLEIDFWDRREFDEKGYVFQCMTIPNIRIGPYLNALITYGEVAEAGAEEVVNAVAVIYRLQLWINDHHCTTNFRVTAYTLHRILLSILAIRMTLRAPLDVAVAASVAAEEERRASASASASAKESTSTSTSVSASAKTSVSVSAPSLSATFSTPPAQTPPAQTPPVNKIFDLNKLRKLMNVGGISNENEMLSMMRDLLFHVSECFDPFSILSRPAPPTAAVAAAVAATAAAATPASSTITASASANASVPSVSSVPERTDDKSSNGHLTDKDAALYTVCKEIDRGVFGVVYLAQEKNTGRNLAIKMVQVPHGKYGEAKILDTLHHPSVIRLENWFVTTHPLTGKEKLNLVLEYMPATLAHLIKGKYTLKGQSLADRIGGRIPLIYTKLYLYQAARALAYIHSRSVCHRDFKPANLLIDLTTHQLKLCDFGLAKVLGSGSINSSYVCTRYYRPPELLLGSCQYSSAVGMHGFAAGPQMV